MLTLISVNENSMEMILRGIIYTFLYFTQYIPPLTQSVSPLR